MNADLLYPAPAAEATKHKLHRLVQSPNSSMLEARCSKCSQVVTFFSHSTTEIRCSKCDTLIGTPTGGKLRIAENTKVRARNM